MTESDVVVRPAVVADMPAVQAIYGHHVQHGLASFEDHPPSIEEMTRRWSEIAGRGFPYFVAEIGGEVLGYAYASPYRARPAYRLTVENSVYVRVGLHQRGIGHAVMRAVIEQGEANGFRQMIAVIGDSENRGSIRLHERLGFRRVGVLTSVGYKFGRWVDSVLMQRSLGAGSRTLPGE